MSAHRLDACRTCAGRDLHAIAGLGSACVGVLPTVAGLPAAAGPAVRRVLCPRCGTVQLDHAFDPADVSHAVRTFDRHSPETARACSELAEALLDRFGFGPGDLVLDVGSNDGTLLRAFHDRGARVLGVEAGPRHMAHAHHVGIDTVGGQFGPALARYVRRRNGAAQLVVSRFALGATPDVPGFLRGLAEVLVPGGIAVLQVRHAYRVFRELGVEMLHAASPCAFSVRGLEAVAPDCGLALIDAEGGPARSATVALTFRRADDAIRPGEGLVEWREREAAAGLDRPAPWAEFARRSNGACEAVRRDVDRLAEAGLRAVGYSASADGLAFLHALSLEGGALAAVVDPSPEFSGKRAHAGRYPVVAPDSDAARADAALLLDRNASPEAARWAAARPDTRLIDPFAAYARASDPVPLAVAG